MKMTDQERYIRRESRMQTFRWATPGGLFVLAAVIGFVGWVVTDELGQLRNAILDLKVDETSHYDKLWNANSSLRAKLECVQNQQAKCCINSTYCA